MVDILQATTVPIRVLIEAVRVVTPMSYFDMLGVLLLVGRNVLGMASMARIHASVVVNVVDRIFVDGIVHFGGVILVHVLDVSLENVDLDIVNVLDDKVVVGNVSMAVVRPIVVVFGEDLLAIA